MCLVNPLSSFAVFSRTPDDLFFALRNRETKQRALNFIKNFSIEITRSACSSHQAFETPRLRFQSSDSFTVTMCN